MEDPALSSRNVIQELAKKARKSSLQLAHSPLKQRNQALRNITQALKDAEEDILLANQEDLQKAEVSAAFRDRMTLTTERLEAMEQGLEKIVALPDPLGKMLGEWTQPNGLKIRKISVPLGVIGMIYESRPNVGVDAAAICLKSGNGLILRGGSETYKTALQLYQAIRKGIVAAGFNPDVVAMAPDSNRQHVMDMFHAVGLIDVLIPRGGHSLISFVQKEARIPVLAHAAGLCHTYIHEKADFEKARKVLFNAKMRRPGICGATETLLIDREIAFDLLPVLVQDLQKAGCRFVGDSLACQIDKAIMPATMEDFATEWLDAVLSVKVVENTDEALTHILHYGSGHTEAIITEDEKAARYFMDHIESAVVMWNTSTQFCDGGEFGFGAEIGIATGRLHARGPVGVEQLTSYRYEVIGNGQVRP